MLPDEKKVDNVNIGDDKITLKESFLGTFSNLPCIKHNVYAENPIILEDMSEIINGCLKAYQRSHIKIACYCRTVKAHDILKLRFCPLCELQYEYVLNP